MLHLRQGTSGHESTPPHEPALLRSQNARRAQVPGWFEKRMQLVCRRRQLSTGQPNLHVSAPLSATCSLTHHQPLGHVQSTARSPSVTLLNGARCQCWRLKLPEGGLATGPRHAGVGSKPSSHARRASPTRDGHGPRSGWSPVRGSRKAARLQSWSSAGALGISRWPRANLSQRPLTSDPTATLAYLNRYPSASPQAWPSSNTAEPR